MRIVAVSGYFDPIHVGHIDLFKRAKILGDKLIVILNNDEQAKKTRSGVLMPQDHRKKIIKAIKWVDDVVISIDKDATVNKTLAKVHPHIFANGGDRKSYEIPEFDTCKKLKIKTVDALGEQIKLSSDLTKLYSKKSGLFRKLFGKIRKISGL